MLSRAAHIDPVAALGQHVADLLFGLHQAALLVDEDAVERLRARDLPRIGFDLAGQQLEQRRLSRAVRSHHADPVAALHAQGEIADDRAVAIAFGNLIGVNDDLRLAVIGGDCQFRGSGGADHRRTGGAHLVQLFEPPLIALAPRGHPAFEPVRLDLQLRIELFGGTGFFGIDLLGPCFEPAEPDFVAADRPAIEPQRLTGEAGEERPVMADDDERARKAVEPFLQPVDRGKVEMVGRFVEQQDIGFLPQRARDRGAAAFASACGLRIARQVDAQLIGNRFGCIFFGRIVARQHEIEQRVEFRDGRFLFQHHDLGARANRAAALIGLHDPTDQLHQRRLARAVAPDQRQPVAFADKQVEFAKEPSSALLKSQIFISQYRCRHDAAR